MKRLTKKQKTEYRQEAIEILREFGFQRTPGSSRDYQVETPAGPLAVSIYDDWLACVFDNVELALTKNLGGSLNQFSGKWNWHGADQLKWFQLQLDHLFGEDVVSNPELELVFRE